MEYFIKKILYFIFYCLAKSCRYVTVTNDTREKARKLNPNQNFITATFHEFSITGTMSQRDEVYCALVSRSKDGEYASAIIHALGHSTVRGSSSKGSIEAKTKVLERLKLGFNLAITIDGPRGPRRKSKAGVIHFSREAQVPIIPLVVNASRQWIFKSWDRFKLPKPFSTLYISYGEPFIVPPETKGEAFEEYQKLLETELENMDNQQRKTLNLKNLD